MSYGRRSRQTDSAPRRCRLLESTMGSSMVRYKVRPDRADENVNLVEAVYAQLARERPEALHYATFRLSDGVSFMHIVIDTDAPGAILGRLDAFKAFTADLEGRCDEPPVVT